MTDHIVIAHHHDQPAGVYRLVIGRSAVDEDGATSFVDATDIVWSDTDDRWADKSLSEIAAEQRAAAMQALASRAPEIPPGEGIVELPGAGEPLA